MTLESRSTNTSDITDRVSVEAGGSEDEYGAFDLSAEQCAAFEATATQTGRQHSINSSDVSD